jgi:hypothetical protein
MSNRQKTRFLKKIVIFNIAMITVMLIAGFVARCSGVDADAIVTLTCSVFGGNLLLTTILRLTEKEEKKPDAVPEERKDDTP